MPARSKLYWLASFYLSAFCLGWALLGGVLTYVGWGVELRVGMVVSLVLFGVFAYRIFSKLADGRKDSTLMLESHRNKALANALLGVSIGVNTLINHVPEPHNYSHAFSYALLAYLVAAINASNIVLIYGYRTGRLYDRVLRFWYWIPAASSKRYRAEIRESWGEEEDA